MGDDLKQKMLGAVTWSTIDRFGQQAVQLVIGMILARLLSPDDYGLLGMVMIFAALSFVLVESGFGQALIRKVDATETDYNTIFYFNIVVSVFLYILLYFLAPFIALFFNQPQLVSISRVIFIAILFNAFYLVPFSKLGKIMDFKSLAKINLSSTIGSGLIGVVMAFLGFGVWALVAQQVMYHFFRMIFFYLYVKWRPSALFSFTVIRSFWKFSIHLLGTSVLNVIFNYIFVIILGKFYRRSEVGYYTQGNKLNETFNFTFVSILVGSTYSLFAQIQNDDERFRRIFREIAQKTSIVTFPVMLGLIAAATPLIDVVWSAKFLPSVPYFQLLCLASLFAPLYTLNISALNSRGESKITFRIEIFKKMLILISLALTFSYGIMSMLWGYALASILAYLISILYIKNSIQHFIKHQLLDFSQSLIIGFVIALVIYFIGFIKIPNIFLLSLQLISAATIYLFVIRMFYVELYRNGLVFLNSKLAGIVKIVFRKES
ncbi:MAG: lipopolysaccharide biosynthesis protein [Paludibacter sp.]|nr:lipopolysaccharide biosynthesis protein [Paludibacter sp.]